MSPSGSPSGSNSNNGSGGGRSSNDNYKPPQWLGDEQARLIRTEAVLTGIKELMDGVSDNLKGINNKLENLERTRAVADLQAANNARDITELKASLSREVIALEGKLETNTVCINDIKSDLKAYKFTGNIMKLFIGVLVAGIVWLVSTLISVQGTSSLHSSAITNLKEALTEAKGRIAISERVITELQTDRKRSE